MSDWKKHPVECSYCNSPLMRRLYRPVDCAPINHFFCNNVCKGAWQRNAKSITEAWLRQKYEVEHFDCTQIASLVQRDPKSVWNWLKGFGIKTRARGQDKRQHFKKGAVSLFTGRKHSPEAKDAVRNARLRDGHFPKQEDGRPYWAGKSGLAHPAWAGGTTPERQRFYQTEEWKVAERAAYTAAHGKCQRCDSRRHLHVHHVIPFAFKRLRADVDNLRVLCASCHRFVHSDANIDREFLPPFGVLMLDGKPIKISYRPKHFARLPSWLTA